MGPEDISDAWWTTFGAAVEGLRSHRRDLLHVNLGDSISTGVIGIDTPLDHYAHQAARIVGGRFDVGQRRAFHTPGDAHDEGRIRLLGGSYVLGAGEGGFYGAGAYALPAGGDALLRYTPASSATCVEVGYRGGPGLLYSTDDGASWSSSDDHRSCSAESTSRSYRAPCARVEVDRVEIDLGGPQVPLLVRSPGSGADTVVTFVGSVDARRPAVRWYTSGIGATRIGDLHRTLSADDDLGYSTYAAAAPDLLTVEIGVNDTIHADEEALERSAATLDAVVGRFLAHGVSGLALVGAVPVRPDFQPGPWYVADAYREVYGPVARRHGIPLLDWARRWGSHASGAARGLYADQVHPSAAGHADAACMIADLVAAAG